MSLERPLESLSDDDLLRGLADLLRQSRRAESDLVAHIAEVETRRLYAREAVPSMFVYCLDVLHLSEAGLTSASPRLGRLVSTPCSWRCSRTAAPSRRHRQARAAPHTTEPRPPPLSRRPRSERQIEELVAELAPRPDVPGVLRRLPVGRFPRIRKRFPRIDKTPTLPSLPLPDRVVILLQMLSSALLVASASSRREDVVPRPVRHLLPFSSRSLRAVTKSSSQPAPSYATS